MTWSASFNFRSTSAYVTDATGETYALSTDVYPTTRSMNGGGSSVTFGWNTSLGGDPSSANRTTGSPNNPELSGIAFAGIGASAYFQVDLPAAGSYVVRIAAGDAAFANDQVFTLLDTAAPLITCAQTATAINHFLDASLTDRTAAAWQSSNTPETFSFATTTCGLHLIGPTVNSSTLAHFSIAAAGGSPFIARPGSLILQAANRASTY